MMETVPENFKLIGDIMSNFDHEIEDWADEKLKAEKVAGFYPGWDFHGTVWFDKKFKCEIWVYGFHSSTISADSLPELMEKVCNEYGGD